LSDIVRRTITGAGIVVFIIGGLWLHPVSFVLTLLLLLSGVIYEYYLIVSTAGQKPQIVSGMLSGIAVYLVATAVAAGLLGAEWFILLLPLSFIMITAELYRKQEKPFDSLAHTFFPLLYIAVPFSLFLFSAFNHTGMQPLLNDSLVFSPGIAIGFFIITWANDSGAYLAGVSFGRHKLMERLSPKKTWEGFFGGLLLAIIAAVVFSGWLGVVDRIQWIVIALIISIAGTYGDLAESMLKRSTGVKDSGSIMPGHGGFLDRFDSTIMAFPLVYLFIALFGG
jgi:phosphatidate cytidylyltransferase